MNNTRKPPPFTMRSIDGIGREVRELAGRELGHEFRDSFHIQRLSPKYEVPGRRKNGSVVGRRRVRWLLGRILLPFSATVLSVVSVVIGGDVWLISRTSLVRGGQNCQALAFADANASDHQSPAPTALWLLFSPTRAVLCKVLKEKTAPELVVLWSAEGPMRPQYDPQHRMVTWPDGSFVQLAG